MYCIDKIYKDKDGDPFWEFDFMVDIPTLREAKKYAVETYLKYNYPVRVNRYEGINGLVDYFKITNIQNICYYVQNRCL